MTGIDWPARFDRTPASRREPNRDFEASLAQTTKDIATEMDRLDPEEWRASIGNSHTKTNTLPRANANPDDPGFVLRWTKDGQQFAAACDRYSRLRDNAREVYLWVHETRMRGNRAVVPASIVDEHLRGRWYDVDRSEVTCAQLRWSEILDPAIVGGGEQ
ncbi:heat shock protein DnaJ domain protein [Haloarcula vallismortis ATCC 29715]|uniref:Heat shock protein DnaJ domain protein n=1 Tax=Haloarcula vallismortis ATCC 29715 TaxID=662477 RepID=M0J241_HALVA|nr:hypothetical protein [Haloarcula vallismortis]EMA01805.1 heat shock protein DnaJ domain protein [Haloarcula vallismortis ATCC 29715]